ncbi:MAG: type II toxin-antitoxin system RelE/ParE family toxin [Firmicutes bacterium]|nr:type II toxin-antitoxin system RelE/ParE family toxin [Bacillota bacterium]
MDNYRVEINPKAIRDLDNIFAYIAFDKLSPQNARGQVERIKNSILRLKRFPFSHQEREEGRFANMGYRQLIIDNYIVIYRIDEIGKVVYIVTIQYQAQDF